MSVVNVIRQIGRNNMQVKTWTILKHAMYKELLKTNVFFLTNYFRMIHWYIYIYMHLSLSFVYKSSLFKGMACTSCRWNTSSLTVRMQYNSPTPSKVAIHAYGTPKLHFYLCKFHLISVFIVILRGCNIHDECPHNLAKKSLLSLQLRWGKVARVGPLSQAPAWILWPLFWLNGVERNTSGHPAILESLSNRWQLLGAQDRAQSMKLYWKEGCAR